MTVGERDEAEQQATPTADSTAARLAHLDSLRAKAALGGGKKRVEQQHARNKLTARERLEVLVDPGSFQETDAFVTHQATEFGLHERKILGDSVVTGYGRIDGRTVCVFSQDFTVFGGSLSEAHGQKVCKIMDAAMKMKSVIAGL